MTIAHTARRHVGSTSLELPVFGLGTAHLGELYAKVAEAESQATLDAAWDAGVRYYDTAPWYGRGLSEHRLGGFLRTKPRGEFQITTKVGRTLHRPADPATFDRSPWTGGLNFEVNFDYTYDGIMRSYEQALQRLALDTVDALVIHDLDADFHGDKQAGHENDLVDSGIKALVELKKSGDIKAYGMGINNNQALETSRPRSISISASSPCPTRCSIRRACIAAWRAAEARHLGDHRRALRLGHSGDRLGRPAHYAYGKASPEIQARVRGIEAVCAAHKVALPAAALQFVLAHPIVVSVIPGAAKPSEVTQNIASLGGGDPVRVLVRPQGAEADRRRCADPGRALSMVDATTSGSADSVDLRAGDLQDLRGGRGAARRRSRSDAR